MSGPLLPQTCAQRPHRLVAFKDNLILPCWFVSSLSSCTSFLLQASPRRLVLLRASASASCPRTASWESGDSGLNHHQHPGAAGPLGFTGGCPALPDKDCDGGLPPGRQCSSSSRIQGWSLAGGSPPATTLPYGAEKQSNNVHGQAGLWVLWESQDWEPPGLPPALSCPSSVPYQGFQPALPSPFGEEGRGRITPPETVLGLVDSAGVWGGDGCSLVCIGMGPPTPISRAPVLEP